MRFHLLSLVALGAVAVAGCSDQNGGSNAPGSAPAASPAAPAKVSMAPSANKVASMYLGPKRAAGTGALRTPAPLDAATAATLKQHGKYSADSHLTEGAKTEVRAHRAHSVPHFAGSYTLGGTTYPYTMVGGDPKNGDETWIQNTILPVSLIFDEFADANGNPLQVDVTPNLKQVEGSPNYQRAQYGTGFTQFTDAVQRAEFWNVKGRDWHTLLEQPRVQPGITLEIPYGAATVFTAPDGAYLTFLDENFFFSQFNTIIQMADFHYNELAILLTPNVFLTDGNFNDGFILGFHTAWDAQNPEAFIPDPGTAKFVQTFAWASWIEPGVFGDAFSDVTGLSHEIAEWTNDPFVDNATENWSFPGYPTYCQNNLETGDPVEVLASPGYPVTIGGYTYHPQTEALLQWFTQETPSSAFQGAYSYPDTTALPGPSQNCAQ
jgi:hypothetical protein